MTTNTPAIVPPAAAPAPTSSAAAGVFAMMAQKFGMDVKNFEVTLATMILPGVRDNRDRFFNKDGSLTAIGRANAAAVLIVANEYNLNPFLKQIYFFEDTKTGTLRPIVGIDGWVKLANEHRAFDGIEYDYDPDGKWVEARLYHKGRSRPWTKRCLLSEFKRGTPNWSGQPQHMLYLRTTAHVIRFGLGFALMDDDDFERMVEFEVARAPAAGERPRNLEGAKAKLLGDARPAEVEPPAVSTTEDTPEARAAVADEILFSTQPFETWCDGQVLSKKGATKSAFDGHTWRTLVEGGPGGTPPGRAGGRVATLRHHVNTARTFWNDRGVRPTEMAKRCYAALERLESRWAEEDVQAAESRRERELSEMAGFDGATDDSPSAGELFGNTGQEDPG